MNYRVLDLFSGCGGLSYGFENEGFNIALGIDINASSIKSFKFNHPASNVITGDICKVTLNNISDAFGKSKIDIVVGGPPCQGFSLSGPRNFDDPRNRLYISFMKIVDKFRPKAFVIENVPGLIGLYNGEVKDEIIRRFSQIGYCVTYKILLAADYGVPQLRRRVFFVGLRSKNKLFNFPQSILHSDNYITTKEAIGDLPSLENVIGESPSLYIQNGNLTKYQKYCRRGSKALHNHVGTAHLEKTREIISLVPEGGNYKNLPKKYIKSRNFHVAWTRFHGDKPSPTIDTGHRHHFHYKYNRVPTVRESARLQSFPDSFIFFGNKSEQYSQVGNAVPPLLAKVIAKKLKQYL